MRALVTGGAGFIGSHLVEALRARGDEVAIVDKKDERGSVTVHRYRCTPKDVSFDAIYHLAAEGRIQPEYDSDHIEDTLLSTYNALVLADQCRVPHFVFTSSGAVYGDGELPISTYGAFKLGAEGLVNAWRERTGKRVSILRLGNVVGPRCRGVIPDTLAKLKADPTKLSVFGDGSAEKPYIHVTDVVQTLLDPVSGLYNLMPFTLSNVRFIVSECIKVVGAAPVIEWGSEPRGWVGDIPTPVRAENNDHIGGSMTSDEAVKRAIKEVWEAMK